MLVVLVLGSALGAAVVMACGVAVGMGIAMLFPLEWGYAAFYPLIAGAALGAIGGSAAATFFVLKRARAEGAASTAMLSSAITAVMFVILALGMPDDGFSDAFSFRPYGVVLLVAPMIARALPVAARGVSGNLLGRRPT